MTPVLLRGEWAEFVLSGRWRRKVIVDADDVPVIRSRKWYWHCRYGAYCAEQKRLLTRVLLPEVRGRIAFVNGDMSDCRRENLLPSGYRRSKGVWFEPDRGTYVASVTKAGARIRVRCRTLSAARAMREKLALMTHAELAAWRSRQDGGVPEELSWMGEDVAPLIATRCAHDAVLAARKGYEAGLMAVRLMSGCNAELPTMN